MSDFELIPYDGSDKPKGRKKTGYAAAPGSGPAGESCKTCKHLSGHQRGKKFYKCGLMKWTFGAGTDIRLKSPACWHWSKFA